MLLTKLTFCCPAIPFVLFLVIFCLASSTHCLSSLKAFDWNLMKIIFDDVIMPYEIADIQRNFNENISYFIVSNVPTDGLLQVGTTLSPATLKAKFGYYILWKQNWHFYADTLWIYNCWKEEIVLSNVFLASENIFLFQTEFDSKEIRGKCNHYLWNWRGTIGTD